MPVLNLLLHPSSKTPPLVALTKRGGDGTYAVLTKSDYGYSCKTVVITNGKRVLEKELPNNNLGGFLSQLESFMRSGLQVKAVLLHAQNHDGVNKALSRLKNPPHVAIQYID